MQRVRFAVLAPVIILAIGGCRGDRQVQQTPPDTTPAATVAAAPDTTEAAFWSYLQQQQYRSWQKWPGTSDLYPGREPHGMLLTTYVNALALDALTNGAAMMPAGAIIVKENFMPDSTLAAVTAMHKVAGYDPMHGDWFWGKWDPRGVAEVSGRVAMCADCHGANAAADYLMTARPQR